MANVKTNAMRILDSANIKYDTFTYESDGAIDGISVATKINHPVEQVFKTLVTKGASKEYYVFVIPVAKELNPKAAAKAVGEKSVQMIRVDEINKLTGYIRGGCSPVGMKKQFRTVIDSDYKLVDSIIVSAGKIGLQMKVNPQDIIALIKAETAIIAE